ncbi:MAG TPA: RES family NAD+ phosphorylase, partial [Acidimicrobiales bacterium]|nr:RES family NAD+ phosphorylase [Acidimicrobiales bacterium]
PDGRWQRGAVVEVFYLADSEETAWAEWYRALVELGLPPHRSLPRDLWAFRVSATVADLSSAPRLAAVGLSPPRPGRSQWPAYQRVGEQLAADGWRGLLAPSAARPEGRVLCLFRNDDPLRGATPLPPPEHVVDAPAPPRGMTT